MKRSPIPWTDFSGDILNFVTGCTPVSEGCGHCYAKAIYERHGWDFGHIQTHPAKLDRLRRWHIPGKRGVSGVSDSVRSYMRGTGSHPLAFVCDTGDLFHDQVPPDFILHALEIMRRRADLDWQILTKRPSRALAFVRTCMAHIDFRWPSNVWLGVTAENQRRADERIPLLLQIPAAVRFVSVEPMLEAVNLSRYLLSGAHKWRHDLSWVICGAESGPHRRPFDAAWAEDLYRQCQEAGVPYFGKQDTGNRPGRPLLIDGREIHEFPEVP